jgi:hypothetical protein
MTPGRRALDKIYKRRDRYDIPDWQREEVWDQRKKQQLIDSILRGWRLPKFYLVKVADDEYDVVDGQQRLQAIYEFFDNELPLAEESVESFGGRFYKDLPSRLSDAFDDFEIDYDEIEDATEQELKTFFQRLQEGLPLTSSEKLNAIHSKLRDFCRKTAVHSFFQNKVSIPNTRYAHFDIVAKAAAVEIEGLNTGLRFDDLKIIFDSQAAFSAKSEVARRLISALDFLDRSFLERSTSLRSRTIIQSLITLTCKVVVTNKADGLEADFRAFFEGFAQRLSHQVELGQAATDSDLMMFQRSVNTNVKAGAKTRHEILLRKLFATALRVAEIFDPTVISESGTNQRVADLGLAIRELVHLANNSYAAKHGDNLFKPTNNTTLALGRIDKPICDLEGL